MWRPVGFAAEVLIVECQVNGYVEVGCVKSNRSIGVVMVAKIVAGFGVAILTAGFVLNSCAGINAVVHRRKRRQGIMMVVGVLHPEVVLGQVHHPSRRGPREYQRQADAEHRHH